MFCGSFCRDGSWLAADGTYSFDTRSPLQVLLFNRSVGIVVQLNVIEMYGILLFRTEREKKGGEEGRVYVFRLSDLSDFVEEDEPAIGGGINFPTWQPR